MTGLVVPVDLLAYCVGDQDGAAAEGFAGATTDFSRQTTSTRPGVLGANVVRDYASPPLWPLEPGIHLHWAMPDALTRASSSQTDLDFPPLPNRWLVSRLPVTGNTVQHWIIESDTLSATPASGAEPPTVPASPPGFRYLGVTQAFTTDWRESPPATGQSILDLTGSELTAVTTGDIAFAAFYPNSRGVFGFVDPAADLGTGPAELVYVVTGWYSASANDPLTGGLSNAELEQLLGWTVSAAQSDAPTFSVYSGSVHRVQWVADQSYITDPEAISADVAVGNNPAEALAAYLRGRLAVESAEPATYEEVVALYLAGLAPALATPAAGQSAELGEALHELQFTGFPGGIVYTVSRGTDEVTALPLPLADALNLLNQLQQAADALAVLAVDARWRLFAAWALMFEVDAARLTAASTAFSAQLARQAPLAAQQSQAQAAASTQYATVTAMLSGDLALTEVPAPRFYTPNEPVVLIAGDAAAPATRYGGDGAYDPNGFLVCRLDSDVTTYLMIGTEQESADDRAGFGPDEPNQLPYDVITALVLEAALIDPGFSAAKTGEDVDALTADLGRWLAGEQTTLYHGQDGLAPSPVEITIWAGNPWSALLLVWQADFHPLLATTGVTEYPPGYVTSNITLDPDQPRLLAYTPTGTGTGTGTGVDPSTIDFDPTAPASGTQRYSGASVLSATAANNLRDQLAHDLTATSDATKQEIADALASTDVQLQALAGFNDALLTRQQSLLLPPGVAPSAPAALQSATTQLTSALTAIDQIPALAPDFDGAYNGVRAGFLKLGLEVVDPFGRKRPVTIENLYTADSLTAYAVGATDPTPGVAYAPPRLAQPSRLLFRWLAADSTEYDEMNAHPATTPVCGWLLPSHLEVGFFVYDAQGNPLGSLARKADGSGIVWQSTPGDPNTIDAPLATVLTQQNPHLSDVVTALGAATPDWFGAVYQAADTAVTQIVPSTSASRASLGALVGRPLALVQATLRMERQGGPAVDQSLGAQQGGAFTATDHGTGGVQFPVVIGDLARLDDGLVGYWTQAADGTYATGTFYSEAAPTGSGAVANVVVPESTTLLLTPQALPDTGPAPNPGETKLLMLVDPRAAVHATMGVLPTQQLVIPPDQYDDLLDGLELTIPATPVLRPAGGLQVPVPTLAGFTWAWIEEQPGPEWAIDPGVTPATAGATWQYSPQSLTEGWLRLNPELLRFTLTGSDGRPVVTAGTTVDLTLTVTNARRSAIVFEALEGWISGSPPPPPVSTWYLHFGSLVAADKVGAIQPVAAGWEFAPITDAQYGTYLGVVPDGQAITLAPGTSLTVALNNVTITSSAGPQSRVYADYLNVTGIDDGLDVLILAVQPATADPEGS